MLLVRLCCFIIFLKDRGPADLTDKGKPAPPMVAYELSKWVHEGNKLSMTSMSLCSLYRAAFGAVPLSRSQRRHV